MKDDFLENKLKNIGFRKTERGDECVIEGGGKYVAYPFSPASFEPKARAVLTDLDGTTVKSEEFWIYLIEKTIKVLTRDEKFAFSPEDIPYVSGFSTSEHLSYAIKKYGVKEELAKANAVYHAVAEEELGDILKGGGNAGAFKPREGLKEFLFALKGEGIKIGLVTSGLDYKAIPEIVSVFRNLKMGDPLDFYDAIITGGKRKVKGQYGTLGEFAVKPHPWVYEETGFSLAGENRNKVAVLEDSASGVISARLAGYGVIGMSDGNIEQSGLGSFCFGLTDSLEEAFKLITGGKEL